MATYWLYILASRPGGALYVGVTGDLSARIHAHREKRGSRHTTRYAIDRLVHYESYDDVRLALQRERNLKHWPVPGRPISSPPPTRLGATSTRN